MAWTTEDYTALKEAMATGAMSVSYNGQQVRYRSLDEMRSIKREMEDELGIVTTRRRRSFVAFKRDTA